MSILFSLALAAHHFHWPQCPFISNPFCSYHNPHSTDAPKFLLYNINFILFIPNFNISLLFSEKEQDLHKTTNLECRQKIWESLSSSFPITRTPTPTTSVFTYHMSTHFLTRIMTRRHLSISVYLALLHEGLAG